MANVCKVENQSNLQNLITHCLFTQRNSFSKEELVNQIMNHKFFNHLYEREVVSEMVCDTINAFLRSGHLTMSRGKYYLPPI